MSHHRLAVRALIVCIFAASIVTAETKEKKSAPPEAPGTAPKAPGTAPKNATPATVDPKTFVIGPDDVLVVRVWRDPEVSGQVTVRPDGKITLQLLGEIQAAGLTPEGLTQSIFEGLQKLKQIDKTEVTVTVTAINSRKYFIQGEVARPGAYPLLAPTTVLEAVVHAGGFREFANTKHILVMRNGAQFKFNYKEVIHGKKLEQNIQLVPGDQIFVP